MSPAARLKFLSGRVLAAGAALALASLFAQQSQAQNLTINFRFDGQSGAGATTQTLSAGTPGENFTVDVFATITGPVGTTDSQVGLVTLRFRGLSSTTANNAFATGNGIGVTSFTMNAPFQLTANIPSIGDVGSASSYAVTSATPDGLSDFGGTAATMAAVANSNTGTTPISGGGSVGDAVPNGWEFEVGQFVVHTGTASASGGTTSFLPVTGLGSSASKSSYTVNGGTTFLHGDWLSGTGINFVVAAPTGVIEDNSNTAGVFGPPQSFAVAAGSPYSPTVDSTVTQVNGSAGSPALGVGGRARILNGTNSSNSQANVTMAWRARLTPSEVSPAQHPPMADSVTTGLVSDVVDLNGVTPGDAFVLDMNYNPALLPKGGPPAIEAGLANNKLIYMVSPTAAGGDGSQYFNTVSLNTGNVVTDPLDNRYGYKGSYAQFQADPLGGNGGTAASELGAWGVDIAAHEVWAVVNHNSTFAVVPEPSTLLLVGLGLLGLVGLRRRVKA